MLVGLLSSRPQRASLLMAGRSINLGRLVEDVMQFQFVEDQNHSNDGELELLEFVKDHQVYYSSFYRNKKMDVKCLRQLLASIVQCRPFS